MIVKARKTLTTFFKILLAIVITFGIGAIAVSYFTDYEIVRPFVVQSGSMEPAIKTASIVFSAPKKSYEPGDVITYAPNGNFDNLITHRIEFKLYPDGASETPIYLTSGDANENIDKLEIVPSDIVGKVVLSVPYLGYAVDFAKHPYGFILLVIIPATIIIYEEIKVLGKESFAFIKRVREDIRIKVFKPNKIDERPVIPGEVVKTYVDEEERAFSPKSALPKSSILLPVLGSAMVVLAFSSSFFFDIETSIGNIFTAAESFGEKTAALYDSDPYTCSTGATNLTLPQLKSAIFKIVNGNIKVTVVLEGATANSSYDIWINQNPGGCPLNTPTLAGAITTDTNGNGTGSAETTLVVIATNFWVSAVGGGQVLRSATVSFP